jgi:hypothetical protein
MNWRINKALVELGLKQIGCYLRVSQQSILVAFRPTIFRSLHSLRRQVLQSVHVTRYQRLCSELRLRPFSH